MGAKRFNGSGWVNMTTRKRYSGGAWKNMGTGRRWDSGEWRPLWSEGPFRIDIPATRLGIYWGDGSRDIYSEQAGRVAMGSYDGTAEKNRITLLVYDTRKLAQELQYASVTRAEIAVFRENSSPRGTATQRPLMLRYSNTLVSPINPCEPELLLGDGDACEAPVLLEPHGRGTLLLKPEVVEAMRDGTVKSLLLTTEGDTDVDRYIVLDLRDTYLGMRVTYNTV